MIPAVASNARAKPPKVLHVFGRMEAGGAEVRLLELMGRLCPHEFQVDVCVLSGLPGPLDAEVRALGGQVVPLRLDASFCWRFPQLIRREQYSVVHSHVLFSSGPVLALAAAAGVQVRVAHFHATHDGWPTTLRRRSQRAASRALINRYATDIISCGEGAMNAVWYAAWRDDIRCRVVYDAVDSSRYAGAADSAGVRAELGVPVGDPLYLHVGRETPEKNHPRLLEIFAALLAVEPSAWLVLAGAGTDLAGGVTGTALRDFGSVVTNRIRRLGVRSDVPRLLSAADVLLLPSVREGLPGAVLEACASGVPVLATDLPGVREIADRLPLVHYLSTLR